MSEQLPYEAADNGGVETGFDEVQSTHSRRAFLAGASVFALGALTGCRTYPEDITYDHDQPGDHGETDPPMLGTEGYAPEATQEQLNRQANMIGRAVSPWANNLIQAMISDEERHRLHKEGDATSEIRNWDNYRALQNDITGGAARHADWRRDSNGNQSGGMLSLDTYRNMVNEDGSQTYYDLKMVYVTSASFPVGRTTHMLDVFNDPTTRLKELQYTGNDYQGNTTDVKISIEREQDPGTGATTDGVPVGTILKIPTQGVNPELPSMTENGQINSAIFGRADQVLSRLQIL